MAVTFCVGMPPATLQRRRYRTAGAVMTAFPRGSVTAIKLSVYRNAKPQLGIGCTAPNWGLAFRQRLISRLMHLNLMALTRERGNDKLQIP
ncbi:MAG: hypothetical protein DM484_13295 [Candidatus Methylumidiphilus alinenensis]|uniref:Uncharacterized protein n=1 Tax=Candidatus Methylumidiphilus alinenensis TaxID=2202197 RepID=A0A2W4SSZ3_9GAMM|nr:MAG: hypothetical protein DM484_13295 [Candidatus Methylumidiphilus alinenensis]